MTTTDLRFERTAGGRRFRALSGEQEVGFVDADPIGADGLRIKHTEVHAGNEGRGIGGALVKHVLDLARREGRHVIPTCSYAAAFIERHPEYRDLVR